MDSDQLHFLQTVRRICAATLDDNGRVIRTDTNYARWFRFWAVWFLTYEIQNLPPCPPVPYDMDHLRCGLTNEGVTNPYWIPPEFFDAIDKLVITAKNAYVAMTGRGMHTKGSHRIPAGAQE